MELITIKDNVAIPSPYTLTINEFKALVDRDKTKGKNTAIKELAYVYFFCDYLSPFSVYEESYRSIEVISNVFNDINWEPDSKVLAACEKYKELKETSAIKLLKAAKESVAKLERYFATMDLTEVDDNGRLVYSAKDLVMNLSKMGDVINGLTKLEEIVKKEKEINNKNRGGVQTNKYSE